MLLIYMSFREHFSKLKLSKPVLWLLGLSIYSLQFGVKADELDTFQLRAGVGKTYDNNIFRRPSGEVSEQITTSNLGVKVDKTYSLQRVMLDLSVIDYKYNVNEYLDFVAKNYNAAWYWSLTPELTGYLTSERTQSLNSFGDVRVTTQQNIRTMTMNQFRAQYSPHNVWAFIFGASQTSLENSESFTAISDFDSSGLDYGLMYQFSSGSSLKFIAHNRRGDFTKRPLDSFFVFDNGYSEKEYEIDLFAQEQGVSKWIGRVGYLKREYDNFSIRNYSSYVGDLSYELQWTGKLRSVVSASRVIAPFETTTSTYSLTDAFKVRLQYDVTSKIQSGLNLSYGLRDFDGSGQFGTSDRSDTEQSYSFFVRWFPIKNFGVSLNATKSSRNSSVSNFNFDDKLMMINFDLKL